MYNKSHQTLLTTWRDGSHSDLESPSLSAEQLHILNAAMEGRSIFFTGGAGTGKTLVLKEIIRCLRQKYVKMVDAVAVTSPTGSAASNIGGVTIHSFAGAGLAMEEANVLAQKIRFNAKALGRWRRAKALIIDEVSMLDAALFDKFARIACILRKSDEPFGGIQLIATGDFFQLPPVAKTSVVRFAFEAKEWNNVITTTFNLNTVFRQRDEGFVAMLNEIRFGQISHETVERFMSLSRPLQTVNGVEPTELFPRRYDVERANAIRLEQLSTPIHQFVCVDGGSLTDSAQRDKLLASFIAPSRLVLRVGAQVMLIKNLSQDLVNGSVGCVLDFVKARKVPDGDDVAEDDFVEQESPLYPLVSFRLSDGSTRELLIVPHIFTIETSTGEVRASRIQIPLILAWAISIHKAQGQTLALVKVDLKKVFETGQVYVALSRATSLEGLQVLNFNPALVRTHARVTKWNSAGGDFSGSAMEE